MRLILHVGHGKTGSSWLQSWLAINSSILASKFNVRYIINSSDPSLKGYFSMGNSHIIEPYLYGKVLDPSDLIDGLHSQGSLLFSGEKLMKILPSCQHRLEEIASSLGTEQPELVLMLRNPFDHALSLYNQKVKSQGLRISFASYLHMYDLPNKVLSFLRKYPSAYAFHYDNYATKLYSPFLDLLSLPDNYEWNLPPYEIVNRSLSQSELQLMRFLNGLLPAKSSRFFGNRLLSFRPNLAPEKPSLQFDNKLVREFNTRWRPIVDAINSFIPKESMLNLPIID